MAFRDSIKLPATVENLSRFREFTARSCARAGGSAEDGFALKLAVDEVCTNVIEHGSDSSSAGMIELTFASDGRRLRITIADTGRPFAPGDAPQPDLASGWEERPVGGLGWHLVRQMVDELHYESGSGGNRLTLIRVLRPDTAPVLKQISISA